MKVYTMKLGYDTLTSNEFFLLVLVSQLTFRVRYRMHTKRLFIRIALAQMSRRIWIIISMGIPGKHEYDINR